MVEREDEEDGIEESMIKIGKGRKRYVRMKR